MRLFGLYSYFFLWHQRLLKLIQNTISCQQSFYGTPETRSSFTYWPPSVLCTSSPADRVRQMVLLIYVFMTFQVFSVSMWGSFSSFGTAGIIMNLVENGFRMVGFRNTVPSLRNTSHHFVTTLLVTQIGETGDVTSLFCEEGR